MGQWDRFDRDSSWFKKPTISNLDREFLTESLRDHRAKIKVEGGARVDANDGAKSRNPVGGETFGQKPVGVNTMATRRK